MPTVSFRSRGRALALIATSLTVLSISAPVWSATRTHTNSMQNFGRGEQTVLLRALRELDLTPDQKAQVRTITADARSQRPDPIERVEDFQALGDPGNPGHQAAVQSAERRAELAVQERSALDGRLYAVLTPAQKSALPGVLSTMYAHSRSSAP